jgi:excisionase family DNA binding protein
MTPRMAKHRLIAVLARSQRGETPGFQRLKDEWKRSQGRPQHEQQRTAAEPAGNPKTPCDSGAEMTPHRVSGEQLRRLVIELPDDTLDALAELLVGRLAERLERPPEPSSAPVAYTVAGLARSLGVSQKTIRGAIHRGELAAVERGSRYVIAAEAARAWASPAPTTQRQRRAARGGTPNGRPLRDALARADGAQ